MVVRIELSMIRYYPVAMRQLLFLTPSTRSMPTFVCKSDGVLKTDWGVMDYVHGHLRQTRVTYVFFQRLISPRAGS